MIHDVDVTHMGVPMAGGYAGGFGGCGFVGGLLTGAILRGGLGLGKDGNSYDCGAANPALLYQTGVNAGENAKYRDIVDSTASINSMQDSNFHATSALLAGVKGDICTLGSQTAAGFFAIGKSIMESDYKNLLQSKELSAQMATGFCDTNRTVEKEACETPCADSGNCERGRAA